MTNILIDCQNGVSGDMLVGALLDLGANEEKLKNFLFSLGLEGFEIVITKKVKNKIPCTDFDVKLEIDNHDHDMQYLYGNKKVSQEILQKRTLKDIKNIIKNCNLTPKYKKIAKNIFKIIAEAEAKAHEISIDEVAFHETGAMDSIIDIMAVCFCLQSLDVQKVYAKNLVEGTGWIMCRAGKLPIPTPAVKNIAKKFDIKLQSANLPYELITPTGIGVLAAIAKFENANSACKKIGYGCGKRDYNAAGVLEIKII